jgi:hypothetical protein
MDGMVCEALSLHLRRGYYTACIYLFSHTCRAEHLQHDHYTVPAAIAELGLLYISSGNLDEAQRRLESARCFARCMECVTEMR